MKDVIESFSPSDYARSLPPTSRQYAISRIESGDDPIEIALQLSLQPGEGLAIKGAEPWPTDMLSRILKETHSLICTEEDKYRTSREKLRGEIATTANVIVFVISNAVAVNAGMAAALCVPLVALVLSSIAKLGVTAWCEAFSSQSSTTPDNVI